MLHVSIVIEEFVDKNNHGPSFIIGLVTSVVYAFMLIKTATAENGEPEVGYLECCNGSMHLYTTYGESVFCFYS